jgi:hypothetical protein
MCTESTTAIGIRRNDRDHRDDHGRDNQYELAEEKQHQEKYDHHRQRRRYCHLDKHLDSERVLGHRQARDVVFLVAGECLHLLVEFLVDFVAEMLVGQRQVKADRLCVFGDESPLEHGVGHGLIPYLQSLGLCLGRFAHQPLEGHGAGPTLADVIDGRGRQQIDFDDAGQLVGIVLVRPLQSLRKLGQLVHSRQ